MQSVAGVHINVFYKCFPSLFCLISLLKSTNSHKASVLWAENFHLHLQGALIMLQCDTEQVGVSWGGLL